MLLPTFVCWTHYFLSSLSFNLLALFLWHHPLSYLKNQCKVSPVKASSGRSPDLQGGMRLRTRHCNEMGVGTLRWDTQVSLRGCWAAASTMSPCQKSGQVLSVNCFYPCLGICLEKKIVIKKDTCTPIFTAALFTIAKIWKHLIPMRCTMLPSYYNVL